MKNLMKLNKLTPVFTAVIITIASQNAMAEQLDFQVYMESERHSEVNTNFLEPSTFSPVNPLFSQLLRNGRDTGGNDLQLKPGLTTGYPNIYVNLFIKNISNEAVSNGGANFSGVKWVTTGSEADTEQGGPYSIGTPDAGQSVDYSEYTITSSGLRLYTALVYGECESLTSFDILHEATFIEEIDGLNVEFDSFLGEDTTTINSTGYYPVNYTVRATDADGGVSDIHFSGKVSVLCSGLNDLPKLLFSPTLPSRVGSWSLIV